MGSASTPAQTPSDRTIRRLLEIDTGDPRWDAFVKATPGATVFHHSAWLKALERENGQRAFAFAVEDGGGTLLGLLPLMSTRGLPLRLGGLSAGRRLSSLPRTPVAGPLGTSEGVLVTLVEAAMQRARSARVRLQLKMTAPVLDGLVPGLEGMPWRTNYVKRLPDDPERLRFGNSRNHGRIRWAVNKAQREGLRVREAANETDLREWYHLYLDVSRWRGVASRPYRFFKAAWDGLHPDGHLRLVLVDGPLSGRDTLLAGSMLLMSGDTVFYAFNGRAMGALPMRPNDLLQWHCMREAAAAGYQWYDFGEVQEGNEGLAGFKAKWDTERRQLVRYHAPPLPPRSPGYGRLESKGMLRRVWIGAWRRAPLPVTALAGDLTYRYL